MRRALGRERGFVATEFVLGVGVLLLPVVVVVLTIPTWSERQTTARAIAREVARTVAREGFCDPAVRFPAPTSTSGSTARPGPRSPPAPRCR